MAREWELELYSAWLLAGTRYPRLASMLLEIGKMQIGIFATKSTLGGAQNANRALLVCCPVCKLPTLETLAYYPLESLQWSKARQKYNIWESLARPSNRIPDTLPDSAVNRTVEKLLREELFGTPPGERNESCNDYKHDKDRRKKVESDNEQRLRRITSLAKFLVTLFRHGKKSYFSY